MTECIQTNGNGSEDCLQLNVYMPGNHSPSSPTPLPVLVYFHGGNLIGGSAPTGSLAVIAVQSQVIAVGVNYRLNTLGFLALDELAAEDGWVGNQGIADAIAALTWVKGNIGVFGGDPARVTLAGQSSGGTLIFALFAAPRAAGLFTGAISMSGSPNITQDATAKRAQDAPLLGYLGCAVPPTPALRVACLRTLNASILGQASNTLVPSWGTPGIFGWSTPPGIPTPLGQGGGRRSTTQGGGENYAGIVHVDGELVTQPFDEALAGGLVPSALIISNMESEGDGSNHFGMRNASVGAWAAFLNASFALWPGGGGKESIALLLAYLPEALVDPDLAASSINSE
jgi:acetyl esterase/lipase